VKPDKKEIREQIAYADKWAAYHNAVASKSYEEQDVMNSAFHHCCARLFQHHAKDLENLLVIFDMVEHIRGPERD
jgi:DNA-directed RNA polymerase subunit N (RpoN/RPB10)